MTLSSEFLPVFVHNALSDSIALLPSVLAQTVSWRRMLAFCQNLRMAGIGELFLSGTSTLFLQRLQQSGRAFASFLEHRDDASKLTSQCLPFFDAVAGGDFEGAGRMARLARRTWARGEEYEEDFLFMEFLMQFSFLEAGKAQSEALLERYERSLQGADDCRLSICTALLREDGQGFGKALTLFLSERNQKYERLTARERIAPEVSATEGQLSVEGLALVRLAERRGLETAEDYLHVPSIARELPTVPIAPNSWKHLGTED